MLLLHGQPGSAGDWGEVVAALGSGVCALAIDRPGWDGRSAATGLEGNAVATVAALDAAAVERAVVVGHSLGAAVAAWTAIRFPERVAALVLASPAATTAALDIVDRVLAAPVAGPLATVGMMAGVGLTLAAAPTRRAIARRLGLDDGYLGENARRLLSHTWWTSFIAEQRALFDELPALERRLQEISAPAIVVTGSADQIVSLAAARELSRRIPRARLEVIEGARHLLPQRHAPRLAEAILFAVRAGDAGRPGETAPPAEVLLPDNG